MFMQNQMQSTHNRRAIQMWLVIVVKKKNTMLVNVLKQSATLTILDWS